MVTTRSSTGSPVPCETYTGFGGAETRVAVTPGFDAPTLRTVFIRAGSKGPTMSPRRYIEIVLDGLRAPGSGELPDAPR